MGRKPSQPGLYQDPALNHAWRGKTIGSRNLFQNDIEKPGPERTSAGLLAVDAIGAYLREKRLSRNVGLEEVTQATGISLGILEALENDDKERLPAEIYTRAFYRKYAEYLAIDADEILGAYQPPPKKNRSDGKYHFGTVVTLKGREENRIPRIAQIMFLAVAISLGCFLLYWVYKQYLASSGLFGFF